MVSQEIKDELAKRPEAQGMITITTNRQLGGLFPVISMKIQHTLTDEVVSGKGRSEHRLKKRLLEELKIALAVH